jgi:long-chain acyl-CoA synthetase
VRYTGNRSARTSYAELAALAERVAAELDARGIAREARVVLWGQNSAEWIAAFFGCVLRGVLVVPLDAAGTPEFARRVLADTSPALVIGDAALLLTFDGSVPQLILGELSSLPRRAEPAALPALKRESPLQILFTSGTTSEPKGIVHTHGNILASVEPIESEMRKYRRYERWFRPLRFLHTLPLSHVFGQFMGMWLPPLLAAEVHFEARLEAERIVRTVRRERITVLAAVPRILDLVRSYLLAQEPALAAGIALSSRLPVKTRIWRFRRVHHRLGWKFWAFVCGGASLPADLEQFWSTLGFAVIQGYGMTETAALITLNHPFKISRGSIGKVLPGREVRIGEGGEISVRGEMVSTATWRNGHIEQRDDPWLATGDLASQDEQGNLRFVGRKNEVIVNSAGLNIHPEDVEAALLAQADILACAVVPSALSSGGLEPVAVLIAPRGSKSAESAVHAANRQLAEYQRVRRWFLWPQPDLPRTSTGKVRRRQIAQWVSRQHSAVAPGAPHDPLIALIVTVTGRQPARMDGAARLTEEFGLDSLGRVQLQSAIEQQFGTPIDDETFLSIATLEQLRAAVGRADASPATPSTNTDPTAPRQPVLTGRAFIYPRWPWSPLVSAIRIAFMELIARPLVWLLLKPRVQGSPLAANHRPMILICNHVTMLDLPLLWYGLPPRLRRRLAVATAGEMLDDWRHARNQGSWLLNALAPAQYWLVTALLNLFPLPRQAGFRRSFAHIGQALDRRYNVLIFPEGRRIPDGTLQPFRRGIGMLARESDAQVLPVALRGMDDLVARRRRWFHAGLVEVRVGQAISPDNKATAENIAETLHDELARLVRRT